MSARKNEEKEEPKADEDGPGSEEEEAEKNDFTDDESMTSSDQEIPQDLYEGFFERQKLAKCGMHALNNSLGFQLCTDDDMTFALEDYIRSSTHEGLHEIRSMHEKRTGWYSSEVMTHVFLFVFIALFYLLCLFYFFFIFYLFVVVFWCLFFARL
jgi:hypothetical protein